MNSSTTSIPPTTDRGVTPHEVGKSNGQNKLTGGIDYYTCTTDNERTGVQWFSRFAEFEKVNARLGFIAKDWQQHGFTGRTINSLSWGVNSRGAYIMRAAGSVAHDTWLSVVPNARQVSRLDLQVTCTIKNPLSDLVERYYEANLENTQRRYAAVLNSRGGKTLYVGSRQSDQCGRLYDRAKESSIKTHGVVWRYEVEIKKPRSKPMAENILLRFKAGEDCQELIQAYVWDWFDARGVKPLFPRLANVMHVEVAKVQTTVDRKLSWLRQQVSPSVSQLIELGHLSKVLDNLGITPRQIALLDDYTE